MNGKRILFIEDRIPYSFLGAGFPRSGKILSTLSNLGYQVTFYPLKADEYSEAFQDYQATLPNVNFIVGEQYRKAGVEEYIQRTRGEFDAVLVTRPRNMAFLEPILTTHLEGIQSNVQIIYDAEAISAYREIRQRELQGEVLQVDEKIELVRAELNPAKIANCIWAVSEIERNNFIAHGFDPGRIRVVGHTSEIRVENTEFNNRRNLLFVGAIHGDTTPNAHSIQWFSEFVLPQLREEFPDIVLDVVGINSSPLVTSLANQNLRLHGRVDNTNGFYDNARVFIAPTQFAAGIPLKIIEAASKGVPIVTTPLIAEQLGMIDGVNVLVAHNPTEFTLNTLRLYSDETLWSSIRDNALKFIGDEYSETKFIRELSDAIDIPSENNELTIK